MNRDEIIRMAREANIGTYINLESHLVGNHLERFAALVAAAEREACAKVCDEQDHDGVMIAKDCADAIRVRMETNNAEWNEYRGREQ